MARRPSKSQPPKFTGEERVCVFHGPELYLQREYLRQLTEALTARAGEVDTLRFSGREAALADVLDELRGVGLMQQHKLVVVDDADEFVKNHREPLERYAAAPEPTATLALRAATWNARWKLHQAVEAAGAVVDCGMVDEGLASAWAVKRAKTHYRAALDPKAAGLLVERLGTDLSRLDAELGKLAVSTDGPIGVEQVEALVGRASDEQAWEVQEALLSGDTHRAISKVHELVDLAGQPDVLVTYFVADLVRKLCHAAAMGRQGVPEGAICKQLRVWGPRQRPFLQAARALGERHTATLLAELIELDARAKSGFGDAVPNLERFCVRFHDRLKRR